MHLFKTLLATGTIFALGSLAQAEDATADIAALKEVAKETTLIKEGDAAAGAGSFATCIACHQPTGAGNPAMQSPRITGLPVWYLTESLKKFKAGMRGGGPGDAFGMQMKAMSAMVATDKMAADIAAHIASLPHKRDTPTVEGDVAKGKELFQSCAQCHGPEAKGNVELLAPPLDTVPDWYVVNQLTKWRNGQRGYHDGDKTGKIMLKHAKALPDDQAVKDVAAYLASLGKTD